MLNVKKGCLLMIPFDEWFKICPHPFMTEEQTAEMKKDYAFVWNAALDSAAKECERLEVHGKNDHRDSWMGNAEKAIRSLMADCPHGFKNGGENCGPCRA